MFKDRKEAGQRLATHLQNYKNKKDTIVIGLPRGGIVVAFEVAKSLKLPLDIVAPRKISMPGNPEAAIGAVTPDGNKILDWELISELEIERDYIDSEIAKEIKEGQRRTKIYRAGRKPLNLKNKTVILIDDGVATGSTMMAAIKSVRSQNAKKIIIAVPVAPDEFLEKVASESDKIICLEAPENFFAVGQAYTNFAQTEDEEVVSLIKKAL